MKAVLLFLAVAVAATYAQINLVGHEVHALILANPSITVAECTKKCDAIFNLVDIKDEAANDNACSHQCTCQINKTCTHATVKPTVHATVKTTMKTTPAA